VGRGGRWWGPAVGWGGAGGAVEGGGGAGPSRGRHACGEVCLWAGWRGGARAGWGGGGGGRVGFIWLVEAPVQRGLLSSGRGRAGGRGEVGLGDRCKSPYGGGRCLGVGRGGGPASGGVGGWGGDGGVEGGGRGGVVQWDGDRQVGCVVGVPWA